MNFGFSVEERDLQMEARAFVKKEWHDKWPEADWHIEDVGIASYDHGTPEALAARREFTKKLVDRGWWTMAWPKEYGGDAAPLSTLFIFKQEMDYQGAPAAYSTPNAVHAFGNSWQKEYFIPKLAKAEITMGLGLSEPNAGSDLASLETHAVRDGDEYVINGSKIWQSTVPLPDWYMVLVRTDPDLPRHRGLSFFMVPVEARGFHARPIRDMMGVHRWHQEFFEDVRVPEHYRIGEENRGWYVVMGTIQQTRANIGYAGTLLRTWEQMADNICTQESGSSRLGSDSIARSRLTDLRIEIEVLKTISFNALWELSQSDTTGRGASMTRTWSGELTQKLWRSFASLLGQQGTTLPRSNAAWAPMNGFAATNALLSSGGTIGEGSREISRNIIAQRGLGLPR